MRSFVLKVLLPWLLLFHKGGVAQFCNPVTQNDENTANFCQSDSTSGHIVHLISGAQRFETVHSCSCGIETNGPVEYHFLRYSAGVNTDDCGVNIAINDGDEAFACSSIDRVFQTLTSLKFSRTTTVETNFCLEIDLGGQTNSTITVTCTTDRRNNSVVTTTHVATTNDRTEHSTSSTDISQTTNDIRNTTNEDEDEPALSTDTTDASGNSAIIGGAVGGGVAVLLIIIIVVILCRMRKRHKSKDNRNNTNVIDDNPSFEKTDKQEVDNATFEKTKTDDDLVVTYNDMYNIETVPDCKKNIENRDKETEIQKEKQRRNDYIVITDNVMYNVDRIHPTDDHYSVPNLTDPSIDSHVGEARLSQIYHEIESNSPVNTECNKVW